MSGRGLVQWEMDNDAYNRRVIPARYVTLRYVTLEFAVCTRNKIRQGAQVMAACGQLETPVRPCETGQNGAKRDETE